MTNLLYDETEEALRASVRALCAAVNPTGRVLARLASDEPYDPRLWQRLADELGVVGLAVPEEYGGAGAGLREVAVVLEELGRAVAPVPYLGSAVVATRALLRCGATDLLAPVAAGRTRAVLVVPVSTAPGDDWPTVEVGPAAAPGAGSGAATVSGVVAGVADALPADLLLVPARDGLYAVRASGPGVRISPVVSLDGTRPLGDVDLTAAPAVRLADGSAAVVAVRDGLVAGAAMLASEQVGVAEWCLDSTVRYVRERFQFGRPVGSFQAVKHRLADVWVGIAEARAVARYAADRVAATQPPGPAPVDAETELAAAVAAAHCSAVAVTAAETCVQLHGGIGFTWEHPAHVFLKRAKSNAVMFGTPDRHRAALARLVDLPGPVVA
ncbi:alkylation response protein AidB-like acyl-CoA dehydrogenase [Micromonospora sp. Llam0]|uniref:acyl-CoA dehydrogenase family protein n=1 Tax=Micromonospora sp. Llam0 TaxID=2485143 RepID=UPI000F498D0F|nr:acyl-CoA dehydrogenase family protein [Micromonospora sp. Llam0]ROO58817.1 alkylation response protein AidB-like acyl-CoA dehydrogenase [Micromonospora sp. Llam0]